MTVAMAAVSETDWIFRRTCGHCWEILTREQEREPIGEERPSS
ncbi:hypothetical protein [Halopolyspora algeriensis]|nr:hypothetical protein [Halopolyspora algeriensis]